MTKRENAKREAAARKLGLLRRRLWGDVYVLYAPGMHGCPLDRKASDWR